MKYLNRILIIFILFFPGTAAPEVFDDLVNEAFELSQSPFRANKPVPIAVLDAPRNGKKEATGLVFEEYEAIETVTSFFDDQVWWLKTRPRGNVHIDPLRVFEAAGQTYNEIPYQTGDYNYKSPVVTPPLPDPVPKSGQYISALHMGHRQGTLPSWPQVLYLGGEAYGRLTGFPPLIFGSSFRLGVSNVGKRNEDFPKLRRIYVRRINDRSFELLGLIDSKVFAAAIQLVATPGKTSVITVLTKIFFRTDLNVLRNPETGPAGVSSMFWKNEQASPGESDDEAHDADTFAATYSGGSKRSETISIPTVKGQSILTDYAMNGKKILSFALKQLDRNTAHYARYGSAAYAQRASMEITILESSAPYTVRLYRAFTDSEAYDNVVAYFAYTANIPAALSADTPVTFRYQIKASR